MAEDPKYEFRDGKFFNRKTGEAIPDEEPVFIMRAKDFHAVPTLYGYLSMCLNESHRQVILDRIQEFDQFRSDYPERMKEPTS